MDQPVVMERTTYFAAGGGSGTSASTPGQQWLFAEGSTAAGFSTALVLANPGANAAAVQVSWLPEKGEARTRSVTVPPHARLTLDPAQDIPGATFGIAVTSSQPIVAERTMTFGPTGMGVHSSGGAANPARTWYLPEGSTAPPFQEQILIANPGAATVVTVAFIRDDGTSTSRQYTVPAQARLTVDANEVDPGQAVSARVTSDQPIVVERSTYWDAGRGGSSSAGIPWDR
jgi:hypothetical protein